MKLIENSLKTGSRGLLFISDTDCGNSVRWKVIKTVFDNALDVLFDDVDKSAALRMFTEQATKMIYDFSQDLKNKILEV